MKFSDEIYNEWKFTGLNNTDFIMSYLGKLNIIEIIGTIHDKEEN